jgi:hypothetical protein
LYGSAPDAPRHSPLNPLYQPPGWDDWQGLVDPSTYNVYGYTLNDNGHLITYGSTPKDYQTAVLAQRAQAFILETRSNRGPLFLSIAPIAPHVELVSMIATSLDGLQYSDMFRWWIRPYPLDAVYRPLAHRYLMYTLDLAPESKVL